MFKVIGDVHSRPYALEKALNSFTEYSPIFLGDILDTRANIPEADKTALDLKTIELVINSKAKIIIGNHDANLLDQTKASKLTKNTLLRLSGTLLFEDFKNKLKQSDCYFSIINAGVEYQFAHAYPFKTGTKTEQIYGQKIEGKRYKWFENYTGSKDTFKICGHYHLIKQTENYCILDGDSAEEECLPVLFIDNNNSRRIVRYYD
jgi:hypothetical protein